jgi:hypothetical protein
MTIDELQAMIDDYTSGNESERLLLKAKVPVAQQLLELVKARPGAKTDYTVGYLEMMIRDYESYWENSERGSLSDIEAEAANVLDNNIFWIAKELMELMKVAGK